MTKAEELIRPDSCIGKANEDEMLFVLLARDPAAPVAIRAWIAERIRIGKNQAKDALLREAEESAFYMECQRSTVKKVGQA